MSDMKKTASGPEVSLGATETAADQQGRSPCLSRRPGQKPEDNHSRDSDTGSGVTLSFSSG